jgi:hypothetical protein
VDAAGNILVFPANGLGVGENSPPSETAVVIVRRQGQPAFVPLLSMKDSPDFVMRGSRRFPFFSDRFALGLF